jgi:hypothetical protein
MLHSRGTSVDGGGDAVKPKALCRRTPWVFRAGTVPVVSAPLLERSYAEDASFSRLSRQSPCRAQE